MNTTASWGRACLLWYRIYRLKVNVDLKNLDRNVTGFNEEFVSQTNYWNSSVNQLYILNIYISSFIYIIHIYIYIYISPHYGCHTKAESEECQEAPSLLPCNEGRKRRVQYFFPCGSSAIQLFSLSTPTRSIIREWELTSQAQTRPLRQTHQGRPAPAMLLALRLFFVPEWAWMEVETETPWNGNILRKIKIVNT
jgi:hypothetical protein